MSSVAKHRLELRLRRGVVVLEQLLRAYARTDQRQFLRPVVTTENANNLSVLIVNRTSREAVAAVDLDRPVLLIPEHVVAVKTAVADDFIAMRSRDQIELVIFIRRGLELRWLRRL